MLPARTHDDLLASHQRLLSYMIGMFIKRTVYIYHGN